jgi:transcription factor C subunit 7
MASTIYLVRHGDRLDYEVGKDAWHRLCQGEWEYDPPLADRGLVMAQETANAIGDQLAGQGDACMNGKPVDFVLASPFLRCIQTANPIAGRLGLPLCLDNCLFEVPCRMEQLPSVAERCRYFPRIARDYESTFHVECAEEYPHDSLNRCGISGIELSKRYVNKNLVLVSHAANVVAIAACLTGKSIPEINPASPCGIFRLERTTDSETEMPTYTSPQYIIAEEMHGSTAHLSHRGTTVPWPTNTAQWGSDFINASVGTSWR